MTATVQKKICMLGGFSVGKTSLVKRYVQSVFSEAYLTTVGVKIDKKTVTLGDRVVHLILWDLAVAWLYVDDALALIGAGGCLEAYGLGALSLGAPAVEQAAFLEGLLPLVETPWLFPSIELAVGREKGRVADLHFWRDEGGAGDGTWVLLLEVTSERDATRRLQQKAYDMTLLQ